MGDWNSMPTHPLAWQPHPKGGAFDMIHGDICIYRIDGRECRLDEALHDGDAFVTWSDGTYGTVKWNHLTKKP